MATSTIVNQRLRNQHLIGASLKTPEEVVRQLCAVQSQDYAGAKWALGQRASHTTSADIDELFSVGKILRTHVMRPTWHFVHSDDIRWLLELTAPRVHAVNAYYYRKFGLNEAILRKSEALFTRVLRGGNQLTRAEITQALKAVGITASGLQLGYILMNAELNMVICSGALSGKQHTYALFEERVPKARGLNRKQALAELAKRYFAGHGPAQLQDFVWWSGLLVADAKSGVADAKLTQSKQDDKTYWSGNVRTGEEVGTTVHLLPNYDEYLIAYKDRSAYSTPLTVTPPTGIFDRHILVVKGKVAGAWRETRGKTTTVTATSLVSLDKAEERALSMAAERYGLFMGKPIELVVS